MYKPITDIEFVVVEPMTIPGLTIEEPVLTAEGARVRLAELLCYPLTSVHILDNEGRAYLVEYTPLKDPDPQIVFCNWPSAKPINRAIVELQKARALPWPNPRAWWNGIDAYVRDLKAILRESEATGPERAFVLRWAFQVRDTGAAIVSPSATYSNYYG